MWKSSYFEFCCVMMVDTGIVLFVIELSFRNLSNSLGEARARMTCLAQESCVNFSLCAERDFLSGFCTVAVALNVSQNSLCFI